MFARNINKNENNHYKVALPDMFVLYVEMLEVSLFQNIQFTSNIVCANIIYHGNFSSYFSCHFLLSDTIFKI